MLLVALLPLGGCQAPTPGERIRQLHGEIEHRGSGVIDLDLSGTKVTDDDMAYIHGLCSNDPSLSSIHTLDLTDTAITDQSLDYMAARTTFTSLSGLKELRLTNTNTSDAAIGRFQQAAPNCRVIR